MSGMIQIGASAKQRLSTLLWSNIDAVIKLT
jgi:hypothetical protein